MDDVFRINQRAQGERSQFEPKGVPQVSNKVQGMCNGTYWHRG
jgi:hypothetical protein